MACKKLNVPHFYFLSEDNLFFSIKKIKK